MAAAAWIPKYDEDRRLWFCDIDLDVGDRYFPFVRLSLARYQPYSVPGLHLSKTVRAEFAQLVPEQRTTIYADGEGGMRAAVEGVAGFNWFGRWARPEAGGPRNYVESSRQVRVQIQRRRLFSRSNLDWAAASKWISLDHRSTDQAWVGRWQGSVKAKSEIDGRFEYRLMVEEQELYDTGPSQAEYVFQSERINPNQSIQLGRGGVANRVVGVAG